MVVRTLAGLVLACLPGMAWGQTICAPREPTVQYLSEKYQEKPVAIGIAGPNAFELFVNPQTGTWTALATTPEGISCVIAAGEDWQEAGK